MHFTTTFLDYRSWAGRRNPLGFWMLLGLFVTLTSYLSAQDGSHFYDASPTKSFGQHSCGHDHPVMEEFKQRRLAKPQANTQKRAMACKRIRVYWVVPAGATANTQRRKYAEIATREIQQQWASQGRTAYFENMVDIYTNYSIQDIIREGNDEWYGFTVRNILTPTVGPNNFDTRTLFFLDGNYSTCCAFGGGGDWGWAGMPAWTITGIESYIRDNNYFSRADIGAIGHELGHTFNMPHEDGGNGSVNCNNQCAPKGIMCNGGSPSPCGAYGGYPSVRFNDWNNGYLNDFRDYFTELGGTCNGPAYVWATGGNTQLESGREYIIRGKGSNKALTAINGNVVQQDYTGSANQRWIIGPESYGLNTPERIRYSQIINVGTGQALDNYAYNMDPGGNIVAWGNNQQNNQYWRLINRGSGYYAVQNMISGRVMDVSGGSLAENANIQQWEWNGTDAQLWQFEAAGPSVLNCDVYLTNNFPSEVEIYMFYNGEYFDDYTFIQPGETQTVAIPRDFSASSSNELWVIPNGSGPIEQELVAIGCNTSHILAPADSEAPSIPSNLSASNVGETSLNLSWNASTDNVGIVGYYVYQNGNATPVATVSSTSASITGLNAGTSYQYSIAAYDAAGNVSAQTQAITVVTTQPVDSEAPSIPTNLRADQITETSLRLRWSSSTDNVGVGGYYVYQNGNTTPVATVSSISTSITGLNAGTSYQYSVAAYDAAGNVSAQSQAITVVTEEPVVEGCTSPQNLSLNKPSSHSSSYGNSSASHANDGNTSGSSAWSADLQHTQRETNPWWEVDLGQESDLQEVLIYNRSDCCQDRLKDFYVLSSSTPFDPTASLDALLANGAISQQFYAGVAGPQVNMSLSGRGRYVRIQLSRRDILHLAEVSVMGCPSGDDPCIGAAPVVIDPIDVLSEDDGLQTLTASPSGGTWGGAANANGSFDPSVGAGTYAVSYSYTSASGCTQIVSAEIVVEAAVTGGCTNATNLALGQPSRQSSTYGVGEARYANDGNRSGSSPWRADLQHTQREAQPWWEVDLGSVLSFDQVKLYNRTDGSQQRLKAFYVLVSSSPMSGSLDALLADGSISRTYFAGTAGLEEVIALSARGRYVRIQLSGTGILHMAEVEVGSCEGGSSDPCQSGGTENLALGKVTSQSSTYGNGLASIGVDGDKDGTRGPWNNPSILHTQREAQPWWQVDLGSESEIKEVLIHNRADCCQNRLKDFYVLVSNTPFASDASLGDLQNDPSITKRLFTGTAGERETIALEATGRYVRVQLSAGNQILHLSEVEVMGCQEGSNQGLRFATNTASTATGISPLARVFPNPAQDEARLEVDNLSADAIVEYSLFNSLGQELIRQRGTRSEQLAVGHLPRGVYFLKIQSGAWSEVKRILLD